MRVDVDSVDVELHSEREAHVALHAERAAVSGRGIAVGAREDSDADGLGRDRPGHDGAALVLIERSGDRHGAGEARAQHQIVTLARKWPSDDASK